MYEHYAQFIPKGINPHTTSTMKTVYFQKNTKNKNKIIESAYYEADRQNIIDEYALRKHWDIFDVDIHYNKAPWSDLNELYMKLNSFKEVKYIKQIDNRLYLFIYENFSENNVKDKIKDYYSGFHPVIHSQYILKIESKPEYI